jgi:protein-arginine kinase
MADRAVLRGFYSNGEDSSGSAYEVGIESASSSSLRGMLEAAEAIVSKVVQAERRARAELSARTLPALADAEGRAIGIARNCRLLGADESAALVSTLRLAALRGTLIGADPWDLGSLLLGLGAGSVALSCGLSDPPEPDTADSLRSRLVKTAIEETEYIDREEEGA